MTIVQTGQAVIQQYGFIILPLLMFADGVFFGLALKKGLMAFVLLIVALPIAYFLGLGFIPKISITHFANVMMSYFSTIQLGQIALGGIAIFWPVGLLIGFWKG